MSQSDSWSIKCHNCESPSFTQSNGIGPFSLYCILNDKLLYIQRMLQLISTMIPNKPSKWPYKQWYCWIMFGFLLNDSTKLLGSLQGQRFPTILIYMSPKICASYYHVWQKSLGYHTSAWDLFHTILLWDYFGWEKELYSMCNTQYVHSNKITLTY